jgi:hypothetical protein
MSAVISATVSATLAWIRNILSIENSATIEPFVENESETGEIFTNMGVHGVLLEELPFINYAIRRITIILSV